MATHDEVAHNWAHQTGRKRNGHAMFYDGDTIYSWGRHFPIAKFFNAPNGERVILFNADSYSVSTSKHQTIVRRAIALPRERVIYLKGLARDTRGTVFHETTLATIPKLIELWSRARSRKDEYRRDIESTISLANRIRELWCLDVPLAEVPEDFKAYLEAHKEEVERKRREADERRAKLQAEQDRKDKEALRKWLAGGGDVRPPHTRIPYVRVVDRISPRSQMDEHGCPTPEPRDVTVREVQTSWGISVPLREALAIYRLAGIIRKCGHEFVPKKEHRVGGWRLDRIGSDGTVRAGCHVIPFQVQHEAAKLAGLA